jgi:hypothetical protein
MEFFIAIILTALMAVAIYLWLGNIWASVAMLSFAFALGIWIFGCMNALCKALQDEAKGLAWLLGGSKK